MIAFVGAFFIGIGTAAAGYPIFDESNNIDIQNLLLELSLTGVWICVCFGIRRAK